MSYVLIFSHVGRHDKVTSIGKAAAFACSLFTDLLYYGTFQSVKRSEVF